MGAQQWAVVTARFPQYPTIERFDAGTMAVHLFDTQDDATEWGTKHPDYICEVVPVSAVAESTDLDEVMTAEQFEAFMRPEVLVEAAYTFENNEDRTLGDYLADLQRRIARMLGEDA